jgi:hypothetical protein
MSETILFRNASSESERVKMILQDANMSFIEVFSLSDSDKPTLLMSDNVYSYRGYDRILDLINSRSNSGNGSNHRNNGH